MKLRPNLGPRLGPRNGGVVTPQPPVVPQSVDLTLYGTDATLTDERATDGFYLFANGATAVGRTVSSATSFAGDVLAEFVFPGNVMGYFFAAFHSSNITSTTATYNDASSREGVNTEGNGGGNTALYVYKSGAYQGPATRNGNVYIELVGTAFKISTGATYAGRVAVYTGTRVDAAARFFAMTDLFGANAVSKSVRIRVRVHPGG